MGQFIEERLPAYVKYGASFKQNHATQITSIQNGDEYRRLLHPFVKLDYQFAYEQNTQRMIDEVITFYQRTNGAFRGFRVKDWADYSTNNFVDTPTPQDMFCIPCTSDGVELAPGDFISYAKLVRWYGDYTDPLCARRNIKKPVVGTVRVSLYDSVAASFTEIFEGTDFTIDTTTGIIALTTTITDPDISVFAGCEFDIPCRFDGSPSFSLHDFATIQGNSFSIKEIFNP